jgi:putative cardiolipin synthase
VTPDDKGDSPFGRSIAPLVRAHPAFSGVYALSEGGDAFAARAILADTAKHTLDAQYYIWHDDMSGGLLFASLYRAAERGVRVRLLLDDHCTQGLDPLLAAFNAHPNIEVRLFNPYYIRHWRLLDYPTDFARVNRRMHNKSFTVDNQATIIGGRNIGDEYFDAGQGLSFADLDILAIGPVVNEVARDFERYWTSRSARPAERVLRPADSASHANLESVTSRLERDPATQTYLRSVTSTPFARKLLAGELPFEWAVTHMVSDHPAKGLGLAPYRKLLWPQLKRLLGTPTTDVQLVSPYFVPGPNGVRYFRTLVERGVTTTVLTNSLEATDVPAVHAGYAKRRKPLLKAGVNLFELKREFSGPPIKIRGRVGRSNSSLHAKTFSVDRKRVFVGSFNFDPRSTRLNTEMGFVIESPALAQTMADALTNTMPHRAYRMRLNRRGKLQWVEHRDDGEIVHDTEPGVGFWQCAFVDGLSVLPIEWLL